MHISSVLAQPRAHAPRPVVAPQAGAALYALARPLRGAPLRMPARGGRRAGSHVLAVGGGGRGGGEGGEGGEGGGNAGNVERDV